MFAERQTPFQHTYDALASRSLTPKQVASASAFGYQHPTQQMGAFPRSLRCDLVGRTLSLSKGTADSNLSCTLSLLISNSLTELHSCNAKTGKELCKISRDSAKFYTTTMVKFHSAEGQ